MLHLTHHTISNIIKPTGVPMNIAFDCYNFDMRRAPQSHTSPRSNKPPGDLRFHDGNSGPHLPSCTPNRVLHCINSVVPDPSPSLPSKAHSARSRYSRSYSLRVTRRMSALNLACRLGILQMKLLVAGTPPKKRKK